MRIMKEGTFGPAAPVMAVKDETEAIRLANDTEFGLEQQFGNRYEEAEKVAREISAGLVTINNVVVSDPRCLSVGFGIVELAVNSQDTECWNSRTLSRSALRKVAPLAHAHVE